MQHKMTLFVTDLVFIFAMQHKITHFVTDLVFIFAMQHKITLFVTDLGDSSLTTRGVGIKDCIFYIEY